MEYPQDDPAMMDESTPDGTDKGRTEVAFTIASEPNEEFSFALTGIETVNPNLLEKIKAAGIAAMSNEIILTRLTESKIAIETAKQLHAERVIAARLGGMTWQAIADAIGMQQSAAVRKWGPIVKARQAELADANPPAED